MMTTRRGGRTSVAGVSSSTDPSKESMLEAETYQAYIDLWKAADALGLRWSLVSTRRTCDEQNRLYAQGRSTPGNIVTNARGCQSWHVVGRAFDISLESGSVEDYRKLGEIWKSWGGKWGGDIPGLGDFGHFEWHPGLTLSDVCPNPSNCENIYWTRRVSDSSFFEIVAVAAFVFSGWWYWKSKRKA